MRVEPYDGSWSSRTKYVHVATFTCRSTRKIPTATTGTKLAVLKHETRAMHGAGEVLLFGPALVPPLITVLEIVVGFLEQKRPGT